MVLLDVHPGKGAKAFKATYGHTNFLRLYSGDESLIDDIAKITKDPSVNPFRTTVEQKRVTGELPEPSVGAKRAAEDLAGPSSKVVVYEDEMKAMMLRKATAEAVKAEQEAQEASKRNQIAGIELELKQIEKTEIAGTIRDAAKKKRAQFQMEMTRKGKRLGFSKFEIGSIHHQASLETRQGSLLDDKPIPDPDTATILGARDGQRSIRDFCVAVDVAPGKSPA